MDKPEHSPSIEQVLANAKASALDEEVIEKIKNRQDSITRGFLNRHITLLEFSSEMKLCSRQDGLATFQDIETFREALALLGFPPDSAEEIVTDEIPHYNKDHAYLSEGIEVSLIIQFLRKEGGHLDMYPSTTVDFPDDMDDDRAREILCAVIEAQPDLSPRDRAQLGIS